MGKEHESSVSKMSFGVSEQSYESILKEHEGRSLPTYSTGSGGGGLDVGAWRMKKQLYRLTGFEGKDGNPTIPPHAWFEVDEDNPNNADNWQIVLQKHMPKPFRMNEIDNKRD